MVKKRRMDRQKRKTRRGRKKRVVNGKATDGDEKSPTSVRGKGSPKTGGAKEQNAKGFCHQRG